MAKRNKGINLFRNVPKAVLPRTRFNMSHPVKFSGDFGLAYPFLMQDVIAGDTWSVACDHFARLAPMVAPIMHQLDVRMHFFFVPTRLLWDDFEDWITGGRLGTWREENPDSYPVFELAQFYRNPKLLNKISLGGSDDLLSSLWDFEGLNFSTDRGGEPAQVVPGYFRDSLWKFSVLPTRAYWLIWNYFFRDQNVQEELEIPTTSGVDDMSWLDDVKHVKGLFKVAWDKDYFTSCSLTPQRGPQVYIPVGSTAPVTIGNLSGDGVDFQVNKTDNLGTNTGISIIADAQNWTNGNNAGSQGTGPILAKTSSGDLYGMQLRGTADLSSAAGTPVDDIREGFALQRFFERLQITGSRFQEWCRGIFGTNPGDARLQMPEYLGSWSNPFIINNVSNTTGTENNPQAGYAGNGLSAEFNKPITKHFEEPGYLIGLYVAMPKNSYQQGVSKLLSRTDWLDIFNPYFEHIGEQPVMSSELYFIPSVNPVNDQIFGYQSQYASYKFINGHSHGNFKKSLDFWHCNREFTQKPTLSESFITYNKSESTDRVFTLVDEDKFFVELNVRAFADRPMSVFSTPKLI